MKKLISLALTLAMLVMVLSLGVGAADAGAVTPTAGNCTYNAETKAISDIVLNQHGQFTATTATCILPNEHVVVSVDMKYEEFAAECGAGLFFDTVASADSNGIVAGMGVMTWISTSFQTIKTWSWKQDTITTTQPGWGDWWDQVGNMAYGDTNTVYTITAEFFEDSTIKCTLKNNTTGVEHVLQEGPVELVNNSEGLYVGVIALNGKASFSNLTVTRDSDNENVTPDDNENTSPDTKDATSFVVVASALALVSVAVISKKKAHN